MKGFDLGLTGSIGMGKSTTAQIFAEFGCAVWDADATVHGLYQKGGDAVIPLSKIFPKAITDGAVSRAKLRDILAHSPSAFRDLESVVHPLVLKSRQAFKTRNIDGIRVYDIPLLYEKKSAEEFDAVAVVYVDAKTQKQRVMSRNTMSEESFEQILSRQIPILEKCALADYVIPTITKDGAFAAVRDIYQEISCKIG